MKQQGGRLRACWPGLRKWVVLQLPGKKVGGFRDGSSEAGSAAQWGQVPPIRALLVFTPQAVACVVDTSPETWCRPPSCTGPAVASGSAPHSCPPVVPGGKGWRCRQ